MRTFVECARLRRLGAESERRHLVGEVVDAEARAVVIFVPLDESLQGCDFRGGGAR
jgi:hypothetical protein